MTKLYKLTDSDGYTRRGSYNQCLWGPDVTHSGTGKGLLCSPGFIHAYTSPLLAGFLNPIHANISNPRLWECEGDIVKSDNGLKVGCISLKTLNEISLPNITKEHRVIFSILCAKAVYKDKDFNKWADNWLKNIDRSESAARSAWSAAESAAGSAAESAESAARSAWSAAESAARSAWSAAESAARSAWSAWSAAESAARSAWSAARSAWSAAESAAGSAAESAAGSLDLINLAKLAYES